MLEDLDRARVLLDLALVHDDDAVGELERFFLIVRDEHARQVNLFVQPAQPAPQLLPHFGVERAERLVEQQHLRLDGQRARERDALPLAAGELRRIAIAQIVELHELQQVRDLRCDLVVRRPMRSRAHAQPERDVLEHRHVTEQRVVLKDEADSPLAGLPVRRILAVEQHAAAVGRLEAGDDPQQRRLAAARRPEQRDELAGRTSKLTSRSAAKLPKVLLTLRMSMLMLSSGTGDLANLDSARDSRSFHRSPRSVFHDCLQHKRDEREKREQRRDSERRLELVFVVENLDVQRQRVRQAADVSRDDRHRAELAHRARVAEDDAVEQAPLDVRQRHAEERLEAAGAKHARRFFFLRAGRFHHRNDLARDERKRHENRREHDAGHGEDNLESCRSATAEETLPPEQQHEHHARDDRRHGKRQIDQRDQQLLAAELEFADRPCRGHAEDEVRRHRDGGGSERELQRRDRVGLVDRAST